MSEPIPSQLSPLLWSADVARPPSGLAPMDPYLPRSASLPVGVCTDSPLLPAPLTSRRIIEPGSGSVVGSPTGEPIVAVAENAGLGRPPFEVPQDFLRLVPLHGCWIVCGAVRSA